MARLHEVMILEQNEDAGGRCRAFKWNGMYLQRGAEGFIGSEENLVELATALGIYDTLPPTARYLLHSDPHRSTDPLNHSVQGDLRLALLL